MNPLQPLQSLGFEMPSPAYLIGAILFGVFGFAAYRRGRRSERRTTTWLGVALMLYPYAVSRTWLLYAVGVALSAWVLADQR